MISAINIIGAATFPAAGVRVDGLEQCNFVYGANGTGKTTVSRLLARPAEYPACAVEWVGPVMQTAVYNRDFVDANFGSSNALPGIFTLGEGSLTVQEALSTKQAERVLLDGRIEIFKATLGTVKPRSGKQGDLEKVWELFTEACWAVKVKLHGKFGPAFKGAVGSQVKFAERVLQERATGGVEPAKSLHDLEARAATCTAPMPSARRCCPFRRWLR